MYTPNENSDLNESANTATTEESEPSYLTNDQIVGTWSSQNGYTYYFYSNGRFDGPIYAGHWAVFDGDKYEIDLHYDDVTDETYKIAADSADEYEQDMSEYPRDKLFEEMRKIDDTDTSISEGVYTYDPDNNTLSHVNGDDILSKE